MKIKIKYHNIYFIIANIYILIDLYIKIFIYKYHNIDISIYFILYCIYFYLYIKYENKKNNK